MHTAKNMHQILDLALPAYDELFDEVAIEGFVENKGILSIPLGHFWHSPCNKKSYGVPNSEFQNPPLRCCFDTQYTWVQQASVPSRTSLPANGWTGKIHYSSKNRHLVSPGQYLIHARVPCSVSFSAPGFFGRFGKKGMGLSLCHHSPCLPQPIQCATAESNTGCSVRRQLA